MRWMMIGCGNLGQAIVRSWIEKGFAHEDCWIVEPHRPPPSKFTGQSLSNVSQIPDDFKPDLVVLAIKPQNWAEDFREAKASWCMAPTLSVMAGIRAASISSVFGGNPRVMRAMPNVSAEIAASVTGLWSSHSVEQAVSDQVEHLIGALGRCVRLEKEDDLDAFTALCGSGPAYVYAFAEALVAAGRSQGLELDETIIVDMMSGALRLRQSQEATLAQLRDKVTSPGGTTQIGLQTLSASPSLQSLLMKAIRNATQRARELSKN